MKSQEKHFLVGAHVPHPFPTHGIAFLDTPTFSFSFFFCACAWQLANLAGPAGKTPQLGGPPAARSSSSSKRSTARMSAVRHQLPHTHAHFRHSPHAHPSRLLRIPHWCLSCCPPALLTARSVCLGLAGREAFYLPSCCPAAQLRKPALAQPGPARWPPPRLTKSIVIHPHPIHTPSRTGQDRQTDRHHALSPDAYM